MKFFLASRADGSIELLLPMLKENPSKLKTVYIATAANPYPKTHQDWVSDNRSKLISLGFMLTDYDLVGKTLADLRRDLSQFDVIYVEGGNVFYLLNQVKKSGFDIFIRENLGRDIVYVGSSAGSMIMGPDLTHLLSIDDPQSVPELKDYTGLGYVKERIIPHAGRDKYKDKHTKLKNEWGNKLLFLSDKQALILDNGHVAIVSN